MTDSLRSIDRELPAARAEFQQLVADVRSGRLTDSLEANARLLDLQFRIQDLAFRADLFSKVVDQAVGSTRSILQTQA